MRIVHLEIPYECYREGLEADRLPRPVQDAFLKGVQDVGAKRLLIFGANSKSGSWFRELAAQGFVGYINSQTIDSGYIPDCDALVMATGPAHYLSCLDRIKRLWPGYEGSVILPYQSEPPRTEGCLFQGGEQVPCHYHRLFVRHDGNIFPCCRLIGLESHKIAHLSDPDILEKFQAYDIGQCACLGWRFRKASASDWDAPRLGAANFEMSLNCQSQCAMCIVRSPFYSREAREYPAANFEALTRLASILKLPVIAIQGGEVLIQEETMAFLETFRRDNPDVHLGLITNGNLPLAKAEVVARIFNSAMVSFYGFTDTTYNTVTRMNLSRTKDFSLRLLELMPGQVKLKLLSTPASFQEIPSFLQWAFAQKAPDAYVVDAESLSYVRYDPALVRDLDFAKARQAPISDIYWHAMFSRSIDATKKVLLAHRAALAARETGVSFEGEIFGLFGLDQAYVAEQGLEGVSFTQG